MIIAVDFDGTLFRTDYPAIIEPNLPIIEKCKELRRHGNRIILWTCREENALVDAVFACAEYGLEFDAINDNLQDGKEFWCNNPRKVYADIYLDDHNVNLKTFLKL